MHVRVVSCNTPSRLLSCSYMAALQQGWLFSLKRSSSSYFLFFFFFLPFHCGWSIHTIFCFRFFFSKKAKEWTINNSKRLHTTWWWWCGVVRWRLRHYSQQKLQDLICFCSSVANKGTSCYSLSPFSLLFVQTPKAVSYRPSKKSNWRTTFY